MSIISTLRRILNDSPGTATNIDYNFQVLEDYVNTALVATDGSNGMSGPLVVGPPVADTHAATKSYVDGLWFTGMTVEFAGDTLSPTQAEEWALCNGSLQSTTDPKFRPLWDVIQYRYGGSGGSFNLPDFRGRVAVGRSDIGADAIFATVGNKGGLRDNELLSHTHTIPEHGHGFTGSSNQVDLQHQHPVNINSDGGGAHSHGSPGWSDGVGFWYNEGSGAFGGLTPGAGGMRTAAWASAGTHVHGVNGHVGVNWLDGGRYHTHNTGTYAVSNQVAFTTVANGTGTTLTDKNMPPWLCVNRIIKL